MTHEPEIHVLVVEDEDAESSLLQGSLGGQNGMTVHHANALGAGMDLLGTQDVDVVLLATALSDTDELDGLVELVECAGTAPVIVLGERDDNHTEKEVLRRGAHDYIAKNLAVYPAIPRIVAYAVERTRAQQRQAKRRREREVVRGVLSAILSVSSECAVYLDDRKCVLLASAAFSKLVGANPEKLVDKPFLGLVDKDDRADVDVSIDRARTSGRLATTDAVTLRKPDGSGVPIVARIASTVLEDGAPCFVLRIDPEGEQSRPTALGERPPVDQINDLTQRGKEMAVSDIDMVGLGSVRERPGSGMDAAFEHRMDAILATLESSTSQDNAMRQNSFYKSEMKADRLSWVRAKYRLTEREQEVLGCIAMGMPNAEIARSLDIKIATVKVHVVRTLRKLDASNRTEAALIANSKPLAYEGPWRD